MKMEGLARGSKYYWLTEHQWKLEELANDLAPCLKSFGGADGARLQVSR